MYTSSFFKYKGNNGVAISGTVPTWWYGKRYKKLAPQYSWWKEWKNENKSEEWYKERYYEFVLSKLNPKEVYEELGPDAVLLCWEAPGKFCHRHIVARWLEKSLNITINEL